MKTILVVDDSAICREPIAATLRLRGYLTLEAANGQDALQIARSKRPDLILLDVTMPVMDGLTCAGELRSWPTTSRIPVIMLTASADRRIILRAAQQRVAGFLLKSNFTTAELLNRVSALIGAPDQGGADEHASAPPAASAAPEKPPQPANDARPDAQQIDEAAIAPPAEKTAPLTKAQVLECLTQEIELRSIKPVLEYVIALTRSSTSTLDDIASAIRQDQALALRVLRVANSSFYQRSHDAKNLVEATQRIGMTAVRNTVIAILAIEHFDVATGSGLIPQRFWQHSLATGVLAELIGESVGHPRADQLFLAGLLHDVGRMVLSAAYPKEYAALLTKAEQQHADLETIELETFELSHVDATRHLLTRWNMPRVIIEAAAMHERPIATLRAAKEEQQDLLVVALANRLAHSLVAGSSGNARLLGFQEFAAELGLDPNAIARITTTALQKTEDTATFYAAQSTQQFCDPLAVDLAKRAKLQPRVAVLSKESPADPYCLFFKQLGWYYPQTPTVVIVPVQSNSDFKRNPPGLQQLDARSKEPVAVVAATCSGGIHLPADWLPGRRTALVQLPCDYGQMIDAVIQLSKASAPVPAVTS